MTTYRCDPPPRLIDAFLDRRHNWHPGEIQTLTGYEEHEFEQLNGKQAAGSYTASDNEFEMLRQAANTLLALPTTSRVACEQYLGSDWASVLRNFLLRDHGK